MKNSEKLTTFLGKNTEWEGELISHGTIRIDGNFNGKVESKGTLIVGEEGFIDADIHVSYIIIRGEVHGNIVSDQRVDIHNPGKVFGNIQAPAIMIDKGVILEGKTRMYQVKDSDETKLHLTGSDEYTGGPPPHLTAIHGIVTDQSTGNPIKNADVQCNGIDKKNALTNASGYYELVNLIDGNWKLKIAAKGYKKGKANIEISDGGTYRQNIELKPKKKRN
jgi:cytoskeletal protein CcmA (bactofilin family)